MSPEEQQIYTAILGVQTTLAGNTATLNALDKKLDAHARSDRDQFALQGGRNEELFGRLNSLETSRDTAKGFAKVSVLVTIAGALLGALAKFKGMF